MTREKWRFPAGVLALGAGVFALSLVAARRELPEWRAVPPLTSDLVPSATEALAAAGGKLRQARARLVTPSEYAAGYERAFRRLGTAGGAYLERTAGAVGREVQGTLEMPRVGVGEAEVLFDESGRIRGFNWVPSGAF